jgi:2-C-methyl-D-erythritol 4-phosphate cytidylyltransferase
MGSSVTAYGHPVADTCKEVVDGLVRRTVPRDSLVTVSGPWLFTREALTDGLARVGGRERDITRLVDFCEAARLQVRVVIGE